MADELDKYRIYRNIIAIDLKSFYASVECAERGLDPFKTPLVVADKSRGGGSIVLAVSPYLRNKGVPGRLRIYELPKNENIIYCKPRMKRYLEESAKIISIYLKYVSKDDIHIYSVDECFIDVTNYRKNDEYKKIMNEVFSEDDINLDLPMIIYVKNGKAIETITPEYGLLQTYQIKDVIDKYELNYN